MLMKFNYIKATEEERQEVKDILTSALRCEYDKYQSAFDSCLDEERAKDDHNKLKEIYDLTQRINHLPVENTLDEWLKYIGQHSEALEQYTSIKKYLYEERKDEKYHNEFTRKVDALVKKAISDRIFNDLMNEACDLLGDNTTCKILDKINKVDDRIRTDTEKENKVAEKAAKETEIGKVPDYSKKYENKKKNERDR